MSWRCKECGGEVVIIETFYTTSTYEISKNYKKGKLKAKEKELWDKGYICNNLGCENNKEYNEYLTDIAEWEED